MVVPAGSDVGVNAMVVVVVVVVVMSRLVTTTTKATNDVIATNWIFSYVFIVLRVSLLDR
jgi:hypothetical protein